MPLLWETLKKLLELWKRSSERKKVERAVLKVHTNSSLCAFLCFLFFKKTMKGQSVRFSHVIKKIGLLIYLFLLLSPSFASARPEAEDANYFCERGYLNCQTILQVAVFENIIAEAKEKTVEESENNRKLISRKLTSRKLALFIIFVAGILAGFNPCLFAVMVFLASVTLSQNGGRKEMLKITTGFSAGIFTMYIFVGLSILWALNLLPGAKETFMGIAVFLICALGLWHIYDAYWLKIHAKSTFRTPKPLKDFMSRMENRNLLMPSFFAGGVFSLVKAPCVGAIYLSVLSVLATKNSVIEGAIYLLFYNVGLMFPVVILGLLLSFGLSPMAVTEFREKKRVEIRLATGVVLLALAMLLQFDLI